MSLKPTMTKASQAVHDAITDSLVRTMQASPRQKQSDDYRLGVSDMGDCRERARHMVLRTPPDPDFSRKPRYDWSAIVGHAIEREVLDRMQADGWELKRNFEVTVTLPSGLSILGHPDVVLVRHNMVLDVKTVNGLTYQMRDGADLQQQFQRRLYGEGCRQAGIVDPHAPVYVGNIWFDRSASDDQFAWVETELLEGYMLDEVDQWISDVTYAVTHDEPAMRDRPYEFCKAVCPFFWPCRGAEDPPNELDDPTGALDRAAADLKEATRMEREAKDLRRAARELLEGENGKTARWVVKSTHVNEAETPAQYRRAHTRVSVKERRD